LGDSLFFDHGEFSSRHVDWGVGKDVFFAEEKEFTVAADVKVLPRRLLALGLMIIEYCIGKLLSEVFLQLEMLLGQVVFEALNPRELVSVLRHILALISLGRIRNVG
jgi:hypothetical protein